MGNDEEDKPADVSPAKKLTPAAQRALAEAAVRRAAQAGKEAERPKEFSGREGPDPARYGDWETKGIIRTSDLRERRRPPIQSLEEKNILSHKGCGVV